MDEKQLKEEYRSWVKSPVGSDLLNYITMLYEQGVDSAVEAKDLQTKALELQNAQAYKTIRSYIERMSSE